MSKSANKRGGSGFGVLVAILLGIGVGILIAFLYAPQRGEATREQLNEQRAQMRDRYGDAITQGRVAYTRAREEVLNRMKQPQEAK